MGNTMSTVLDTPETVAELIELLGVPAHRIRCQPPPGTATEPDVIEWNQRGILCELIDGVLVEKPVGQYESRLAMWLGHFLLTYLEESDLGIVHGPDSPHRLKLGLVRYPDVAFVSYDRLPEGRPTREAIAPSVPDLAVEIVSAGNTPKEMDLKREQYFTAGVRIVWYVYPDTRTIQVFTATNECTNLGENDTLDGGDLLPGFSLSIRKWFDKAK
jgi:Uma2 family endonuclease